MADLNVPLSALEAASRRATAEQRSLTDVAAALLRDYAAGRTWLNLPPDPDGGADIHDRLRAAEDVCVLYGWTGARHETGEDRALHELWSAWADIVGPEFTGPGAHPELSSERIAELARQRDETRARTLAKIREQYPDLLRKKEGEEHD